LVGAWFLPGRVRKGVWGFWGQTNRYRVCATVWFQKPHLRGRGDGRVSNLSFAMWQFLSFAPAGNVAGFICK